MKITSLKRSLNIKGQLFDLETPIVMGIVNLTSDSFYEGSRFNTNNLREKAEEMIAEGASIIDIGAYSSRPGASDVSEEEELTKVVEGIEAISDLNILISVDTFRGKVARSALEAGASIINDISAWQLDQTLLDVVAEYKCPYILMHMKGTPANMQTKAEYSNVTTEVFSILHQKLTQLKELGIHDVIIDPGFGFGKTIAHNFQLLDNLAYFGQLDCPILCGISRKSMIYKTLETTPKNALNGTTALHMAALERGATILRTHDVREAHETITLFNALYANRTI